MQHLWSLPHGLIFTQTHTFLHALSLFLQNCGQSGTPPEINHLHSLTTPLPKLTITERWCLEETLLVVDSMTPMCLPELCRYLCAWHGDMGMKEYIVHMSVRIFGLLFDCLETLREIVWERGYVSCGVMKVSKYSGSCKSVVIYIVCIWTENLNATHFDALWVSMSVLSKVYAHL